MYHAILSIHFYLQIDFRKENIKQIFRKNNTKILKTSQIVQIALIITNFKSRHSILLIAIRLYKQKQSEQYSKKNI